MSVRSKRLADFLEQHGWEIYEDITPACKSCGRDSLGNYCGNCGKSMPSMKPIITKERREALAFLEDAIAYALREREIKK
jgi:hypothetical protein